MGRIDHNVHPAGAQAEYFGRSLGAALTPAASFEVTSKWHVTGCGQTAASGQWVTEFADPVGFLVGPSIAVDAHDHPHIAYEHSSSQVCVSVTCSSRDLKYTAPVSAVLGP